MKVFKSTIQSFDSKHPSMRGGGWAAPSCSYSSKWNAIKSEDWGGTPSCASHKSVLSSNPPPFLHHSFHSAISFITSDENSNSQCLVKSVRDSSRPFSVSASAENSFVKSCQPPVLLLNGDTYHISWDGTARTLYRLKSSGTVPFSVEECYHLKDAKKSFSLRRETDEWHRGDGSGYQKRGCISMGESLGKLYLQELDYGFNASTGGTTWESSILMAMYFASFPQFLLGHVIELGSGVGLGGMLCAMKKHFSLAPRTDDMITGSMESPITSFTFTDYNPMVLEQCLRNLAMMDPSSLISSIHVAKLDWFDFLAASHERPCCQQYDTIVACDCAYRPEDLSALASTIASLLRNHQSQAHIFGPQSRTGVGELVLVLRNVHGLQVTTELLEMERIRLAPSECLDYRIWDGAVQECPAASISSSSFLHIMCSLEAKNDHPSTQDLSAID